MGCFLWMQRGCPGIPAVSACRNNLSQYTPMRTPVVNGGLLKTHSREVGGECLARTGPRQGSEYHLRPWSTALRNSEFAKATSNSARPFPRTGEIAVFANFTKSTSSFPPFFFCFFNLLRMVRLLHLELLRELLRTVSKRTTQLRSRISEGVIDMPLIFSSVASDTRGEEGMKDQKKILLGLIGVGNWAKFAHLRVLRLLPEYEIVAVYNQRK